ncbi:serine hydrolase [Pelagibius sp.]|uniref:serine hydrolase domain-containing protein n=1 Tax=Pelagibius sp. TaxID=1931238 RepID=UPI002622A37F|nr:serine hydrolase domain-containing protein [Pelagibius sp.]
MRGIRRVLAVALLGIAWPCAGYPVEATSLKQTLEAQRAKHGLVGLAGLVLKDGEVREVAAVGLRRKGHSAAVTTDDLWHLGSVTKAMTATMIARLVERGVLDWATPLSNLLPAQTEGIHGGYHSVTLEDLLTHRGGLPANFSFFSNLERPPVDGELPGRRLQAVMKVLTEAPVHPPHSTHLYSNVGYTLAGVIAEQATGASWEALMRREVFMPLGITSAGFGAPGRADGIEQPWGHQTILGMMKRAVAPGPKADNNAVLGPAGTLHMSLQDWARFVQAHLAGPGDEGALLQPETFRRLHRPLLEDYAYGWVAGDAAGLGARGPLLWHNGSNTMWYALMLLLPEHRTAILLASNDGDLKAAEAAMQEAAQALVGRYLTPAAGSRPAP